MVVSCSAFSRFFCSWGRGIQLYMAMLIIIDVFFWGGDLIYPKTGLSFAMVWVDAIVPL